jgi:hypothetical protein
MDLQMSRVVHSATAQYNFFCAAHGISSKLDHILGHKSSLNKYKKAELTPFIMYENNAIKLEFNIIRKSRKYSNNWRLYNTLLHDQ